MPYLDETLEEAAALDSAALNSGVEPETPAAPTASAQPDPYATVLSDFQVQTPEELALLVKTARFFQSEQGKQSIKDTAAMHLLQDRQFLTKAVGEAFKDKHLRKLQRDLLGSAMPNPPAAGDEFVDSSAVGNPEVAELREMLAEQAAQIQQLAAVATRADNGVGTFGAAAQRSADYNAAAEQDEELARFAHILIPEANELMARRPQDFAGPGGIVRAAKIALAEGKKKAALFGGSVPKPGPRIPSQGRGGTVTKPGGANPFDPKEMQKIMSTKDFDGLDAKIARWQAINPMPD